MRKIFLLVIVMLLFVFSGCAIEGGNQQNDQQNDQQNNQEEYIELTLLNYKEYLDLSASANRDFNSMEDKSGFYFSRLNAYSSATIKSGFTIVEGIVIKYQTSISYGTKNGSDTCSTTGTIVVVDSKRSVDEKKLEIDPYYYSGSGYAFKATIIVISISGKIKAN